MNYDVSLGDGLLTSTIQHINTFNFYYLQSLFDELVENFSNNNKQVKKHRASLPYTPMNVKIYCGLTIDIHYSTSIGEQEFDHGDDH